MGEAGLPAVSLRPLALLAGLAALLASSAPCRAGAPISDDLGYRSLSFRGGDRSACGSFLLTETGVLFPLDDAGPARERKTLVFFDGGWMKNVAARSALGASVFWEGGDDYSRGGLRLRYRRWLGSRTSLELSPGIVLGGNDEYDPPGFIGQAAFNAADVVSVVVEGEAARYRYLEDSGGSRLSATRLDETTFRAGLRVGSHPGLAGILLMSVLVGVLAVTDGGGLGW